MRRQMRRQNAEISTRIFKRRVNCEISLRTILFLTLAVGCATLATADTKPHTKPHLGPNVLIFDPAMPQAAMQQQIDKIYSVERGNEFGPGGAAPGQNFTIRSSSGGRPRPATSESDGYFQ